ncbi:MAG: phosphatase PAP2 family protein [Patescibacteria group bacterium]|jgi:undecaprenyl-diphosphatase
MKKGSYLLILTFLLASLGVLIYFYTLEEHVISANIYLSKTLQAGLHPFVPLLRVISSVEYFIIPMSYVLPFYFYFKKQKLLTALTFLSASSWIVGRILKEFFLGPCPGVDIVNHLYPMFGGLERFFRTQCFPSGHVFDYVSILGMNLYLCRKVFRKDKFQIVNILLTVFIISTIGLSRVALGAHWVTDVVAGYLFGGAWLSLLIYFYRQLSKD